MGCFSCCCTPKPSPEEEEAARNAPPAAAATVQELEAGPAAVPPGSLTRALQVGNDLAGPSPPVPADVFSFIVREGGDVDAHDVGMSAWIALAPPIGLCSTISAGAVFSAVARLDERLDAAEFMAFCDAKGRAQRLNEEVAPRAVAAVRGAAAAGAIDEGDAASGVLLASAAPGFNVCDASARPQEFGLLAVTCTAKLVFAGKKGGAPRVVALRGAAVARANSGPLGAAVFADAVRVTGPEGLLEGGQVYSFPALPADTSLRGAGPRAAGSLRRDVWLAVLEESQHLDAFCRRHALSGAPRQRAWKLAQRAVQNLLAAVSCEGVSCEPTHMADMLVFSAAAREGGAVASSLAEWLKAPGEAHKEAHVRAVQAWQLGLARKRVADHTIRQSTFDNPDANNALLGALAKEPMDFLAAAARSVVGWESPVRTAGVAAGLLWLAYTDMLAMLPSVGLVLVAWQCVVLRAARGDVPPTVEFEYTAAGPMDVLGALKGLITGMTKATAAANFTLCKLHGLFRSEQPAATNRFIVGLIAAAAALSAVAMLPFRLYFAAAVVAALGPGCPLVKREAEAEPAPPPPSDPDAPKQALPAPVKALADWWDGVPSVRVRGTQVKKPKGA